MTLAGILFTIAVIVLIYIVIRYLFKEATTLTTLLSGEVMTSISASSLATNANGNASNFAYSVWFYVNDWNYRYGEYKVLFGRMNGSSSSQNTGSVEGISGTDPSPVVAFGSTENNIYVSLGCFPGANQEPSPNSNAVIHKCKVDNFPIQRWVNLLVSVYGRTLDVYMDGKLVKTCLLPGVAMVNQNSNVYLTPGGGFNGYTSKLQYFANPINPQQAWNIYSAGYGTNMFNNNYQLKVSFEENGSVKKSFTI
jgi:hypothetical protein